VSDRIIQQRILHREDFYPPPVRIRQDDVLNALLFCLPDWVEDFIANAKSPKLVEDEYIEAH
jgi:hypothetical protein